MKMSFNYKNWLIFFLNIGLILISYINGLQFTIFKFKNSTSNRAGSFIIIFKDLIFFFFCKHLSNNIIINMKKLTKTSYYCKFYFFLVFFVASNGDQSSGDFLNIANLGRLMHNLLIDYSPFFLVFSIGFFYYFYTLKYELDASNMLTNKKGIKNFRKNVDTLYYNLFFISVNDSLGLTKVSFIEKLDRAFHKKLFVSFFKPYAISLSTRELTYPDMIYNSFSFER